MQILILLLLGGVLSGFIDKSDFKYIREVVIDNPGGKNEPDVHVEVVFDTSKEISVGQMHYLCNDVRFVTSDDEYLDFWLEGKSCGSSTTIFWVFLPEIFGTSHSIYLIYGTYDLYPESMVNNSFTGNLILPIRGHCPSGYVDVGVQQGAADRFLRGTMSRTPSVFAKGGSSSHSHQVTGSTLPNQVRGSHQSGGTAPVSSPTHTHYFSTFDTYDENWSDIISFCTVHLCAKQGGLVNPIPQDSLLMFLKDPGLDNPPQLSAFSTGANSGVFLQVTSTGSGKDCFLNSAGTGVHSHEFPEITTSTTTKSSVCVEDIPASGMAMYIQPTHCHQLWFVGKRSDDGNGIPSYVSTLLYLATDDLPIPSIPASQGLVVMADGIPPYGYEWEALGFDNKYLLGTDTAGILASGEFGPTGGSSLHVHPNYVNKALQVPSNLDCIAGDPSVPTSDQFHGHNLDVPINPTFSQPSYVDLLFLRRKISKSVSIQPEKAICFGLTEDDANVCNTVGTCEAPNSCSCSGLYLPPDCNEYLCFGEVSGTESACSGHGTCLAPGDHCLCQMGFLDADCARWKCHNKFNNASDVCSFHGVCQMDHTCSCEAGYSGDECNAWRCGSFWNDKLDAVCSQHGDCVAKDTCICETSYQGSWCDDYYCFQYFKDDPQVCSTHGTCSSPHNCDCQAGYEGSQCERWFCEGIERHDGRACSSHGTCESSGTCVCDTNYYGNLCHRWQCPGGLWNDDLILCSGHGVCNEYNLCDCDEDYFAPTCNRFICFGKWNDDAGVCSGSGVCSSPGYCSCDQFYFGEQCDNFNCFNLLHDDPEVCSGMGTCSSPHNCDCESGYTGPDCSTWECFGKDRFHPSVCGSHGDCSSHNNCDCFPNYHSHNCTQWLCGKRMNMEPEVCSSHGTCFDYEVCECELFFSGEYCEEYTCWGKSMSEGNELCEGHGHCIDHDVCECFSNYTGDSCEIFTCFGESRYSLDVCNGYGTCKSIDECECSSPEFFGIDCGDWECFGVNRNLESEVCHGNGVCSAPDKCICAESHTGIDCGVFACYGIAYDHPNVCYRSGKCKGINECVCTMKSTYGRECSEVIADASYLSRTIIIVQFSLPSELVDGREDDFRDCTLLVNNLDDFPSPPICSFKKNAATTQHLNISFSEGDGEKKRAKKVKKLLLLPVTDPGTVVELKVSGHPDDVVGLKTSRKAVATTLSIVFPLVCAILVVGSISMTVLYVLYMKKKKFLKRVERLDGLDILLQEMEAEEESPASLKLKIDRNLFEFPEDDLVLKASIGSGGSGSNIFLAESKSIGKIVVAKVFPTNCFGGDQGAYDLFEKEITLCCSLHHPHVLHTYGCILKGSRIAIIMEHAEGGSLKSFVLKVAMTGEHIELGEKIRLLIEICMGMMFLVSKNVIHRDLKPDNVLLDKNLRALIIDFGKEIYDDIDIGKGLSKCLAEAKTMTRGIGTAFFMAPEITLGAKYDFKVDVFSFAIMMWVMWQENVFPYGKEVGLGIEQKVARDENLRPEVPENYGRELDWYVDLMKKNWSHQASNRLNFKETLEVLQKNKANLIGKVADK